MVHLYRKSELCTCVVCIHVYRKGCVYMCMKECECVHVCKWEGCDYTII